MKFMFVKKASFKKVSSNLAIKNFISFVETENELNWALDKKEFKDIEERVNPKVLMSCKTNALIKAFEVSRFLVNLLYLTGPSCSKATSRNYLLMVLNSGIT